MVAKETPKPLPVARAQTILLVDDEIDILDSLKELFEGAIKGVQVLTAESGAKALELLRSRPVDVIVSDFKMPGMDGLQFLVQARAAAPGVPRVLVTAFPDLDVALRAINEASIENFFTKPLDPAKVIQIIRDVLGARRADEQRKQAFARSLDALRKKPAA